MSNFVVTSSYDAGSLVIYASRAQDGITIGTTAQHTFTVPAGVDLPSWLSHAWEADTLTLADGDPVSTWTDSIAGSLLTATTTIRPLWRADNLGYPALQFDGSDDYMTTDVAFRATMASGGFICFALGGYTYQAGRWLFYFNNAAARMYIESTVTGWKGVITNIANVSANATVGVASDGTPSTVYIRCSPSGTLAIGEGATESTAAAPAAPYSLSTGFIARRLSSVNVFSGHIRAIYASSTNPSPSQITEMLAYTTAKWGTP